MNILITITIIIVVLFLLYIITENRRFNHFQDVMRISHPCMIFIGEERYNGRIELMRNNFVTVQTIAGAHVRNKKEVYPVRGYHYQ